MTDLIESMATEIHPGLSDNLELLKGVHACLELARRELSMSDELSDMEFMHMVRLAYPSHNPIADNVNLTARIEADYLAIKSAAIGGAFEFVQRLHKAKAIN